MSPLEGFKVEDNSGKTVYLLKNSLYEVKHFKFQLFDV